MIGGLKSWNGIQVLVPCTNLKAAKFIKITSSGVTENHPHNVTITREAPNYSEMTPNKF